MKPPTSGRSSIRVLAIAGVTALLLRPIPAAAQSAPSLGSADSFAVLGGSAVTNANSTDTTVTGNLGVSPGNTIAGLSSGAVKLGAIFRDDATARQAQRDAAAAFHQLDTSDCTGAGFGNFNLTRGVYCFSSSAQLTGTLTLDAKNDPHAVWIFKIPGALTAAAASSVAVVNGGKEANVFWQVGSSCILGEGSVFVGTILARDGIAMKRGATLSGRALAQLGAVTLDTNKVSLCCDPIALAPASLPGGTVGTPYKPTTIAATGGTGSYRFSHLSDLPLGLNLDPATGLLSGTPMQNGRFNVTIAATDTHGCTGLRPYVIDVCGPIDLSPILPTGCGPFVRKITVSGGTPPYTFSAPPVLIGVTVLPDGTLSGEVTTPGCYDFPVTATDALSCSGTRIYKLCRLAIVPATLPDGVAGNPYTQMIKATGGTPPYTFSTNSADFSLVSLDPSTAILSANPAAAGCFTFTVTVIDALGFTCSITYTVCFANCAITILPAILLDAIVGTPYNQTFTPSSGKCIVTGLPTTFFPNECGITGTPTSEGCFPFTVTATDAGISCSKSYTLCAKCPAIDLAPLSLPEATAGVPYSVTIVPSGGTAPYTCSLTGALPNGLSLTGCVISGTPMAPSGFGPLMIPGTTVTITATDKYGCRGMRAYAIRASCPAITILPPALPNGTAGTPYAQAITAGGSAAPQTFRVASGLLPPGLSLSNTGTLSGTPTTIGSFCFSVASIDTAGCSGGPRDYAVVIDPPSCPAGTVITISLPTIPPPKPGVPYSQMLIVSGGTGPYTFSIAAGALPPGLSLNGATGTIFGTPTANGSYDVTITATDANGCLSSACTSLLITVDIPALPGWAMLMMSIVLAGVGLLATGKGRLL